MKTNKSYSLVIVAGTFIFLFVFIFASIKIYDIAYEEAKRSHQLKQMEMAKSVATGIDVYITHLIEDLYTMAHIPEINALTFDKLTTQFDHFYEFKETQLIKSFFITDKTGKVIYLKGEKLPNWAKEIIQIGIDTLSVVKPWFSTPNPIIKNNLDDEFVFIILVPFFRESVSSNNSDNSKINGLIAYVLSFEYLMEKFIKPLKLGESDFAWVIDGNGRLVYHHNHREMLLNTTNEKSSFCNQCHENFDVQNKMLKGPASIAEYYIKTEPEKIMAYAPVELFNERWIIAISTYLPEVTANLRRNFSLFFIMVGFVFISFIVLGYILFRVNIKRIKALETEKHLEFSRELQLQLEHSARLASIGELVDSVAHEINTPLSIISVHADSILLPNLKDDNIRNELNIIKQQTDRVSKYTKSLLAHSSGMAFKPELIDIKVVIDNCVYLLEHYFQKKKINITKKYPSNLPKASADKVQLEQVFFNILKNAADAIVITGRITINLFYSLDENKYLQKNEPGKIIIEISDNGCGIDSENIDKIFNPFFSTKSSSEGIGLGLAISKTIILRHNGSINVKSKKDEGTRVTILLPTNKELNNND